MPLHVAGLGSFYFGLVTLEMKHKSKKSYAQVQLQNADIRCQTQEMKELKASYFFLVQHNNTFCL